jgi:hypothetical protein
MKICPVCRTTYNDDNLNFCLEDGSLLTQATANPLPETVLMNQPRLTEPQAIHSSAPPSWPPPQQHPIQQKKSSKTWLWAVGILGLVVLVCGGGFAGLMVIGIMNADNTASNTVRRPPPSNTRVATTPASSTPIPSPSSTVPAANGEVTPIDMSDWADDPTSDAIQEFDGTEFILAARQKRYYYVVVAKNHETESATTRVTVRNVDDADSTLGYGLVFHSSPIPLIQDYAFLIDAKKKRYRIVRHEPGKEIPIVVWTSSPVIKDGSRENILEVRDANENASLYINGEFIKSVPDTHAFSGGVAGIYSGDGVKAGFKNLEVQK